MQRPQQQELGDAQRAGDQAGVGGQSHRTDPRHQLAAADQIGRIGQRAAEYQQAAPGGARAADLQVVAERQQHAQVTQRKRPQLAPLRTPPPQQDADQQHQGRGEIEDQPLQGRGDVGQAEEIQEAGQVVAEHAQRDDSPTVARLQRRRAARRPQRHRREARQRHQHAQGQQGHRIDAIAIAELDDDGLAGKCDRAAGSEQHATEAGLGGGGGDGGGRTGRAHRAAPRQGEEDTCMPPFYGATANQPPDRRDLSASAPLPRLKSDGSPRCLPVAAWSRPASMPPQSPAGSRRPHRRAGGSRPHAPRRPRTPA
ncbi:hypothetical protein NB717_001935 [Xanthomonas sacchari]|nr:hypothetical protein [Xanthomonas sacchari]MCW0460867.1 hypothetical protein [Xanthomonas sacchari]